MSRQCRRQVEPRTKLNEPEEWHLSKFEKHSGICLICRVHVLEKVEEKRVTLFWGTLVKTEGCEVPNGGLTFR